MAISRLFTLVLSVSLAGCYAAPRRIPASDLNDENARLFNGYSKEGVECWTCHDGTGQGSAKGPNLFMRVPRAPKSTLVESITKGRGRMPDFGSSLTADEIDMLVDWLKRTYRRNE